MIIILYHYILFYFVKNKAKTSKVIKYCAEICVIVKLKSLRVKLCINVLLSLIKLN